MPASAYLADANLNWMRGNAFPAAPGPNLFVSLHSNNPGYNGVNNDVTTALLGARVAIAISDFTAPADSPGGAGREMSNSTLLTLTNSAIGPAVVTYFGLWTAVSAGNFLTYGLVTPATEFLVGDVIRFPAGRLVIKGGV